MMDWNHTIDAYQAAGRYTFTSSELESELGISVSALGAGLRRLKKQGRLVSPRRGFYVIVPLEYRRAGSPPTSWFVDDLMSYLGQPYYVGLLTAAALHGAAHQQAMVFQVLTDQPVRSMEAGRSRIQFHSSRRIDRVPVDEVQTETGSMRVSTPEATAFDLVHYFGPDLHPDLAVEALKDLLDRIEAEKLVQIADLYPIPDVQRLGYLCDQLSADRLAEALARRLDDERVRKIALVSGRGVDGAESDSVWKVVPNLEIGFAP